MVLITYFCREPNLCRQRTVIFREHVAVINARVGDLAVNSDPFALLRVSDGTGAGVFQRGQQ
jgi:hypothetical protein